MKNLNAKTAFLFLCIWLAIPTAIIAQVQFNIRGIPGTDRYMVSMTPSVSWAGGLDITNSVQVSIRVPHGTNVDSFEISNLVPIVQDPVSGLTIQWGLNGYAIAPTENPTYDYYDFGMLTFAPQLPYSAGNEVNLFSFENAGNCISDPGMGLLVEVVDNDTDPFVPAPGFLNSASLNTGNEISPLGALSAGTDNAFAGIYFDGNADCSANFPVEWLYFDATPTGSVVDIEWATATESNNEFFSVERSVDGLLFEELQRVPGKGNSSETQTYNTIDPAPIRGYSYYRLRQVDFDGGFTYSDIVEVYFDPESISLGLEVFPNPNRSNEGFYIEFDTREAQKLQLELYAPNGQVVYTRVIDAQKGKNSVEIPAMGLSTGVYMIRLFDNQQTESKSMIIH